MLLTLWLLPAHAATFAVLADGSGDYKTISAAISAAKDGDTIEVGPGTWAEGVNFGGKDLEIVSTDGPETTILAPSASPYVVKLVDGESSAAILDGFTIQNPNGTGARIVNASPIFRNLIFQDLGGAVSVGGIVDSNGDLTLEDCTFEGNTGINAGHIYVDSATLTISGTTFSDGESSNFGGAIYAASSSLVITDSTIEYNSAVAGGGGVYLSSGSTLDMVDSEVSNNDASAGHGSGVFAAGSNTLTLSGGTFEGNGSSAYTSGYHGGAIYQSSGTLDISGTTFSENLGYYGGAIYLAGTSATVDSATFEGNFAYYYGGAAFYAYISDWTETNGTYSDNSCYYGGGAAQGYYYFFGSYTDTLFTGNNAVYGYGGALYANTYGGFDIQGTNFDSNTAYYSGGALYAYFTYTDDTVIADSTFGSNTATNGYGGALYGYYYAPLTLTDSVVENNSALYSGGGIYNYYYGSLTIRGTTLSGNEASTQSGGAVYFYPLGTSYALDFEDNEVRQNLSRYEGGGLYANDLGSAAVVGNTFVANELEDDSFGGGIYVHDLSSLSMVGNTVASNRAFVGGGAYIGARNSESGDMVVRNNAIVQNRGRRYGGGVAAVNAGTLTLQNNDLLGNQALDGGGGLYVYETGLSAVNNIFGWTVDGGALLLENSEAWGAPGLGYNTFFDNADGDLGELVLDEDNNLYLDPLLPGYVLGEDPSDQSYALGLASPCIDAGDPALVDLDGSRADIGLTGGLDATITDADADGWSSDRDCDDGDDAVYPGADDAWYDGSDADCAGNSDYDQDGDGADASAYEGADCDDEDAAVTDCPTVDTGGDSGDSGSPDSAPSTDSAAPDDTGEDPGQPSSDTASKPVPNSCACGAAAGASPWSALVLLLGLLRRRSQEKV